MLVTPAAEQPSRRAQAWLTCNVRQNSMSPELPWSVVCLYATLAAFSAEQRFCIREFRGRSRLYGLLLGYWAGATMLFGVGYLVAYGMRVKWWAPFILYGIGLLVSMIVPWSERIVPTWIWAVLSFVGVPICAWFLIALLP